MNLSHRAVMLPAHRSAAVLGRSNAEMFFDSGSLVTRGTAALLRPKTAALLILFAALNWCLAQQPPESLAGTNLTTQQDHRLMMELLGIKSLRPGANPNNPQATNAVNYDEA